MLVFSIDYEHLMAESDWMLFHPDSLIINIEISASYALGLIAFSIESQIAFPWDGPMLSTQFESSDSDNSSSPASIETLGITSSQAVIAPIDIISIGPIGEMEREISPYPQMRLDPLAIHSFLTVHSGMIV